MKITLKKLFRTLPCFLLVLCFAFFASCTQIDEPIEGEKEPTEPVVAEEEKTVWDYSIDDLANYLVQCGDLVNDDYANLTSLASQNRSYYNVEIYWWDTENLSEFSDEYKRWKEYEQNGFAYIYYGAGLYFLTNNGPFGMNVKTAYRGDRDKLIADYLAFPSGYVKQESFPPVTVDCTRDREEVYTDYDALAQSYPDLSYRYESENSELPSAYCIRDEYLLYAQAQSAQGMCWAFTGATALSTAIMKAKGEFLDFSESWITLALTYQLRHGLNENYSNCLDSSYIYGNGSGVLGFDLAANISGVLLEQDFGLDESFYISEENADEAYEYYSSFSNTDLMNEVTLVHYSNYAIRSKRDTILDSLKSHILNDGSIIAWTATSAWKSGAYNGETVTYKNPNELGTADHVVSIIGWDDDFTVTESGKTYRGAWIVLNSWGQAAQKDGVLYILYDDSSYINADTDFFGYRYIGNDADGLSFSDRILSSTANETTPLKGAYYGSFQAERAETKQKNIFYHQDDFFLTYSYEISADAAIKDIRVYSDGKDVTDLFSVSIGKDTYSVGGEGTPSGEYKILITYSDGEQTKNYFNCFFLCDGTEINTIYRYDSDVSNPIKTNAAYFGYYLYGNSDYSYTYYTSSQTGRIELLVTLATYSTVSGISSENPAVTATALSKDEEQVRIAYDLSLSDEYSFILSSASGERKKITVKVVYTDAERLTRVFCAPDGGESVSFLLPSSDRWRVPALERAGADWYYDASFTDPLIKDEDGNSLVDFEKAIFAQSPKNYVGSSVAAYANISSLFLYEKGSGD